MSKPSVDMANRMSSPLMVFLFSWWQRSLASDVIKLINSLTHSCTHSLASFAICAKKRRRRYRRFKAGLWKLHQAKVLSIRFHVSLCDVSPCVLLIYFEAYLNLLYDSVLSPFQRGVNPGHLCSSELVFTSHLRLVLQAGRLHFRCSSSSAGTGSSRG